MVVASEFVRMTGNLEIEGRDALQARITSCWPTNRTVGITQQTCRDIERRIAGRDPRVFLSTRCGREKYLRMPTSHAGGPIGIGGT